MPRTPVKIGLLLTRPGRVHILFGLSCLLLGCSPSESSKPIPDRAVAAAPASTAESCRVCHASIYADWQGTDHALANRLPGAAELAALKRFPGGLPAPKPGDGPLMILGHKPAWQPLLPAPGGRWQAHEMAFDPARQEWFNAFGDEKRQPGDWGHWTGRGMNWNTQCAQCHMTGYHPGYDAATDTFHPTWVEQGVGCVQCHGEPGAGHGQKNSAKSTAPATLSPPGLLDRARHMQTCLPCHSRNEALAPTFRPGDTYHDHFRLTLPVNPGTYYPDGQQRDEVFNGTSLLLSRMGHAGVTCLDCHDPHTSKTRLPAADNTLCQQCHAPPGRVLAGGTRAVPIDPLTHSHHAEGSPGNSCIACHMPTTNYLQRSPRHDHGWLKPDPLLTQELGIPNACARCHTDQSTEWLIARADQWYGEKLDSRQRARARAIAAAQAGQAPATDLLLKLLADEDIPGWRATYLDLLAPHVEQPAVRARAETSLHAASPLERASAVRVLSRMPDASARLRPLLNDPVRLVRIDAALALTAELAPESPARRELDAYLQLSLDQPAGLTRVGLDQASRGRYADAIKTLERAEPWDASSTAIRDYIARIQTAAQQPAQAAASLTLIAQKEPDNADACFRAGLAYAEAGQPAEALKSLRLAVQRDPTLDRAWYNLALLLAGQGQPAPALEALAQAEKLRPRNADYLYTAATIHWKSGDRSQARAAAQRTLAIDPAHSAARRLLEAPPPSPQSERP